MVDGRRSARLDDHDDRTMERGRGEWRVHWNATSTMTADAERFHVAITVSAFAAVRAETNDEMVFERSYGYDIARDHC